MSFPVDHFTANARLAGDADALPSSLAAYLLARRSKTPVVAASTGNAADLAALSTTLDGVTLVEGDRVLLKDQTTGAENGIYVVGVVVAGPVAPLTRATDFNTSARMQAGAEVYVKGGTVNGGSIWTQGTTGEIIPGTTATTWTEGAGSGVVPVTAQPTSHAVRGASTANIADLASFTVAGVDGLTYAAGERILLKDQSTGAQNGIYVVGTVGGGTAALTRATDMPAGAAILPGTLIQVAAGTVSAGRTYKVTNVSNVTVGTTTPTYDRLINSTGLAADVSTGATAALTGLHAAVLADAAVIGGIEVTTIVAVANGATADTDVVLTHKTEVTSIEVIKTGAAGGVADTITVKNGATDITNAMDINVADKTVVRPGTIDDAQTVIAAAGTLRVSMVNGAAGGNNTACRVIVRGVRRT